MHRDEARLHAETFHQSLKALTAAGNHFLDEEIVLAFAANAQDCRSENKVPGDVHSNDSGELLVDLAAPRIVDVCSLPGLDCSRSPDWAG